MTVAYIVTEAAGVAPALHPSIPEAIPSRFHREMERKSTADDINLPEYIGGNY